MHIRLEKCGHTTGQNIAGNSGLVKGIKQDISLLCSVFVRLAENHLKYDYRLLWSQRETHMVSRRGQRLQLPFCEGKPQGSYEMLTVVKNGSKTNV